MATTKINAKHRCPQMIRCPNCAHKFHFAANARFPQHDYVTQPVSQLNPLVAFNRRWAWLLEYNRSVYESDNPFYVLAAEIDDVCRFLGDRGWTLNYLLSWGVTWCDLVALRGSQAAALELLRCFPVFDAATGNNYERRRAAIAALRTTRSTMLAGIKDGAVRKAFRVRQAVHRKR